VNDLGEFDYFPPERRPRMDAQYTNYPPPGQARPARHRQASDPQSRVPALVNGRPGPGYSPVNGAMVSGYPQPDGWGTATYQPYPPANGGPHPGYTPPGGQAAAFRYPSRVRRPDPGYPPFSGQGAPGYPHVNGRPALALPPDATLDGWAAAEDPPVMGRGILGWLPFFNRLVLLPKNSSSGGQEMREHRDVSGGWLRPAVFGAMDGLVTNASLIAGVGGGGGGHGAIVLTGIAGLVAGAFSMATGEFISVTSQNELTAAEVELERLQHRRDPAGKRRRLTQVFIDKGVSPNLAEAVVRQISADPDRAVATHVREELGIDPDDLPSPRTAATASFAAFTVGALIPLAPFLIGLPNLKVALAVAALAAFAGGAAVAKLTDRPMLAGGLRQFVAAFLATGMAFVVGHVVGGRIG
jgi:vacuolar iron transporter family protein